jgi:hypothetical protein
VQIREREWAQRRYSAPEGVRPTVLAPPNLVPQDAGPASRLAPVASSPDLPDGAALPAKGQESSAAARHDAYIPGPSALVWLYSGFKYLSWELQYKARRSTRS